MQFFEFGGQSSMAAIRRAVAVAEPPITSPLLKINPRRKKEVAKESTPSKEEAKVMKETRIEKRFITVEGMFARLVLSSREMNLDLLG
jgi:hypothetical protein